jgi:hypothetical protein
MNLDHGAGPAMAVRDLAAPTPGPAWKAPGGAAPLALQGLWEVLGMRPGLRVEEVVQQLIEVARRIEASDRAIALHLVEVEEERLYEAGGYRSVHEFAEVELDMDRGRVDELLALGKWGRTACNDLARVNAARRAAVGTEPARNAPARPVVSAPNVRREPPGLASSA